VPPHPERAPASESPPQLVREVQGVSIPARELGGDFFNYFDLPGGEVALLMGDVSGKGVPAALLMANLQATLRARLPVESDLADFASRLDAEVEAVDRSVDLPDALRRDPRSEGARAALRERRASGSVRPASRGSSRPTRPDGAAGGPALGPGYREDRVPLAEGDALFLYTDGLLDAEDASGEAFRNGPARLVLSGAAGEASSALLARAEEAVRAHRGAMEAPDDAAMLVLRVGGFADGPAACTRRRLSPPLLPLGATCAEDGVNFALYSRHASEVWLLLFDAPDGPPTDVIRVERRTRLRLARARPRDWTGAGSTDSACAVPSIRRGSASTTPSSWSTRTRGRSRGSSSVATTSSSRTILTRPARTSRSTRATAPRSCRRASSWTTLRLEGRPASRRCRGSRR